MKVKKDNKSEKKGSIMMLPIKAWGEKVGCCFNASDA